MIDYDMPMVHSDIMQLKAKAMIVSDKEGNDYVQYKEVLDNAKPKKLAAAPADLNRLVLRVQSWWRMHVQRKRFL